MPIGLERRKHMKTYEPIQAIAFDTIEAYNEFMRTEGLVYVNTLVFGEKLVLLYTLVKEDK